MICVRCGTRYDTLEACPTCGFDPADQTCRLLPDRRSGEDRRGEPRPNAPERRQCGRPKGSGDWDSLLSVRVPKALHDALIREALRRDVPLSRVIRERLFRISKSSSVTSGT